MNYQLKNSKHHSTIVMVFTSLPPDIDGHVQGIFKLHIPFITINKPTEGVSVAFKWFGEESNGVFFTPAVNGIVSSDLKTVAIYPVKTNAEQLISFLKKIQQLEFSILSESSRIGTVLIQISSLNLKTTTAKIYPIMSEIGECIGEVFISIQINIFGQKINPDHGSVINQKALLLTSELRKDTNLVVDQIISKAKELRLSLAQSIENEKINYNLSDGKRPELNNNSLLNLDPNDSIPSLDDIEYLAPEEQNVVLECFNDEKIQKYSHQENEYFEDFLVSSRDVVESQKEVDYISGESTLKSDSRQTDGKILSKTKSAKKDNITIETITFFKLDVDLLKIENYSDFKLKTWFFYIIIELPWFGEGAYQSWDKKGHRNFSNCQIVRLVSDKEKDGEIHFKYSKSFLVDSQLNCIKEQLRKYVNFTVEVRDTRTKMRSSIGSCHLNLQDVLQSENNCISTVLRLEKPLATLPSIFKDLLQWPFSLKIEARFLNEIKKYTNIFKTSENSKTLQSTLIDEVPSSETLPKIVLTNQDLKKTKQFKIIKKPMNTNLIKVRSTSKETQTVRSNDDQFQNESPLVQPCSNVELEEKQIFTEEKSFKDVGICKTDFLPVNELSCFGNTGKRRAILSIDQALHLPIVYEKSRGDYFWPTTYVTINHGLDSKLLSTVVVNKSCAPVYKFHEEILLASENCLVLKVWLIFSEYGKSKEISSDLDKLLGFAVIDLQPFQRGMQHIWGWYPILNSDGEFCGHLKVAVWLLPNLVPSSMPLHGINQINENVEWRKTSQLQTDKISDSAIETKLHKKKMKVNMFIMNSALKAKNKSLNN